MHVPTLSTQKADLHPALRLADPAYVYSAAPRATRAADALIRRQAPRDLSTLSIDRAVVHESLRDSAVSGGFKVP